MPLTLAVLSSMATREVLAELCGAFAARGAVGVALESVGGVEAAKRVRAGERTDVVVLASDAVDALVGEGRIVAGSRVDVARSGVSVAIRAGGTRPDIGTEEALRRAVLDAASVGYSTGPSGTYLAKLFERWGIADAMRGRTVQAAPGVPVAALVARGEVALGFQQRSELVNQPGIEVVGPLPAPIQLVTTFSGGVAATSTQPGQARDLLAFLGGPDAAPAKRRFGMEPA